MKLRQLLTDYLTFRRSLGFKLHSDGKALKTFVTFMEENNMEHITTKLALEWAKKPMSVQPSRWSRRLSYIREFSKYCLAMDNVSEIPATSLLPNDYQRVNPYYFTEADIEKLLTASLQGNSKNIFFNQTLFCLFGLMSVTGMRISETLNLNVNDVDFEHGLITIQRTKFSKSRLVPLHPSTLAVMVKYQKLRDKTLGGHRATNWFINKQKNRVSYDCVNYHFKKLLKSTGISQNSSRRRAHLHDIRHYFARSTLIRWYQDKQNIEHRLPILSTFLGHVETRDTYWYLSSCPELMNAAKDRLESKWEKKNETK